jgi:phosphoribosylformylglycinamidine cyclo-ligase
MGHRMEIYLPKELTPEVIAISQSYGIDAQIIGFTESSTKKELIIEGEIGRFEY